MSAKLKIQKIFYIWNYLEWGGAQVYFFGLMKRARNDSIVLALMPNGSNKQLLKFLDDLQIEYEFFDSHTDIKPASTFKRKLERHWNKFYSEYVLLLYLSKIDFQNSIAHVELAPWQSFLAIFWLCARTNVFITIHNSVFPPTFWRRFLWQIKFRILTKSSRFNLFAANEDAKKSIKSFVSAEFFNKITVTSANVNPDEISQVLQTNINREQLREKYNLSAHKFMVFCVGQFIDRKGRWIFLEAARELIKTNDDIAFVWISNSKPDDSDLQKARSFGLEENFTFITADQIGGEHSDLFKLLRLADVFTLPSYLEGLPISLLEAMALGIPSITTNVNGIPEAVKHLETGYLIEPGDSIALKNAIQILKNDSRLRKKLSKNGSEFIAANYNEYKIAEIAMNRYEEAFRKNNEKEI